MYSPIGIQHKILNNIVWELRKHGFWVERHSYSFRAMIKNYFIGSFHVYPGYNEVVVKLYGNLEIHRRFAETVITIFKKYLPNYRVKITYTIA